MEIVNHDTGVLFYTKYFTYNKLNFAFYCDNNDFASKLYISGSLHYYFNDGNHNANDFTYINLLEVVTDLEQKFEIKPYECKLRSLEFGINIMPLAYPTRLILQNIFYHQRKKFYEPINKPYKQSGNTHQNDFLIKVYDKAYQFPKYVEGELLRFEMKYCRMRELKKIGIENLSDLLIKENHLKLLKILLLRFSEILMYDFTINQKKLTTAKQKNCTNYSNSNFWENKLIDIKDSKLNIKNFDYHKKQLKKIISQNSKNIQQQLLKSIEEKGIKLLNLPSFKWRKYRSPFIKNQSIEVKKCTPYTHLYIGGIKLESNNTDINTKARYCPVTGLNISMQIENSQLLSNTGLKHYETNEPKLFKKLINVLLTGKYNKFEKTLYSKLSKQIRNRYYGNKSIYNPKQIDLFEQKVNYYYLN